MECRLSFLIWCDLGFIEARAVPQLATFEAGVTFARSEGFISAPETNHAIRVGIDEAIKCRESGKAKTILIAHSGHGHFDMSAYDQYLSGKLSDYEYPADKVKEALASLPKVSVVTTFRITFRFESRWAEITLSPPFLRIILLTCLTSFCLLYRHFCHKADKLTCLSARNDIKLRR